MSHSPRPMEASDVGSHVKSTPEWLSCRKGGSENPELWLSHSGIVAQFAPDYSQETLRRVEHGLKGIRQYSGST
ncbi:hypothetical protein, partial [Desulfosporosinus burensis]